MKDWKTTVIGVLTAFFYLITVAFQITIPQEVQNAIIVLAIFLIGLLARDSRNGKD
jgi:hypothetical protein